MERFGINLGILVSFLFIISLTTSVKADMCSNTISANLILENGVSGSNLGNWTIEVFSGNSIANLQDGTQVMDGNPVQFIIQGMCAETDYTILAIFDNETDVFFNRSVFQAENQDINITLSTPGGILKGFVWANESNQSRFSSTSSTYVEIYNSTFDFIRSVNCPRGRSSIIRDYCEQSGIGINDVKNLSYYTALPAGTYYVRAFTRDQNDWERLNVSEMKSVTISDNSVTDQNVTSNMTGKRIELGTMDFGGRERTGMELMYRDSFNAYPIKRTTSRMEWGDESFAEVYAMDGALYNVSMGAQRGYLERNDTTNYNSSTNSRFFMGIWTADSVSGTGSLNGIVIDENGQVMNGASIKVYIMKVYNSSIVGQDPEMSWMHRDWKETKINSTTTGANGKFSLTLPSPINEWIVTYGIVAEWDNTSTAGADYVRSYDRNGWRGYDFSGNREINNSVVKLKPGVTLSVTVYQPNGSKADNGWIQNSYSMMGLGRTAGQVLKKQVWGYEREDYDSEQSRGGNFQDPAVFTVYAPIGTVTVSAGLDASTQTVAQNDVNSSYMCRNTTTTVLAEKGKVISINCSMELYNRTLVNTNNQGGQLVVINPDSGEPLYTVDNAIWNSPYGYEGLYPIFMKDTSLVNFTFVPWGPPTFAEVYNHNITTTPLVYVSVGKDVRYRIDSEMPETIVPGEPFNLRVFPRSDGTFLTNVNITYDLYYSNQTFFQAGTFLEFNNDTVGDKSNYYYNKTLTITSPGGYIIIFKVGNKTDDSFTYTMEQRDVEIWNTDVKVKTDKWRFTRGEAAQFRIMAFNSTSTLREPLYNGWYKIELYNPETQDTYVLNQSVPLTADEDSIANFNIPEYINEGWYRLSVEVYNETFRGRRNLWFHLTNMNFVVNMEKFEVAPDEDQTLYITARDKQGNAISNMTINATDTRTSYVAEGTTDSDGKVTLTIPCTSSSGSVIYDSYNNEQGYHEIEIVAVSADGKREKTFEGFVVMPVKLFIDKGGKDKFKPGESMTWKMGMVSLQNNQILPPDEECMPDGDGYCQNPEFEGMKQMIVNKGDFIPGPPITLQIYFPNGTLYYEKEFEGFEEAIDLRNPLYDLSSITAGLVRGTYKVKANLKGEITTKTFFDVVETQIKAEPNKFVYNASENISISVKAFNYTSDPITTLSGRVIKARLMSSTGVNLTGYVYNTTGYNGVAVILFNVTGTSWSTGVLEATIEDNATGDSHRVRISVDNLAVAAVHNASAGIDMGGSVRLNFTVKNSTQDGISGADVIVAVKQPNDKKNEFTATDLGDGNYTLTLNMGEYDPSGTYYISVEAKKVSTSATYHGSTTAQFTVNGYELELFEGKEGKPTYSFTELVPIKSKLKYSNGSGVSGATLSYEVFDVMRRSVLYSGLSSTTDSNGNSEYTFAYNSTSADKSLEREGVFEVKVFYKIGSNEIARQRTAFMISSLQVTVAVDNTSRQYLTTELVRINMTATNGSSVPNSNVKMFVMPPSGQPYEVTSIDNTSTVTETNFNATIGPFTTEGRYEIVGGVQTLSGSFGDDFIEIWIQSITVNATASNMTYTEGDNVSISINASNSTHQINGTATIRLMEKKTGLVNQSSITLTEGFDYINYSNMTLGAYMAEIEILSSDNQKGFGKVMFGVKPSTEYSMATKDSTGTNERNRFISGETVNVVISPSLPSATGSVLSLIKPDKSLTSITLTNESFSLSSSYFDQSGWYILRLDTSTMTGITGSMIEVS